MSDTDPVSMPSRSDGRRGRWSLLLTAGMVCTAVGVVAVSWWAHSRLGAGAAVDDVAGGWLVGACASVAFGVFVTRIGRR